MVLKQRLSASQFLSIFILLILSSGCAASSAFKRGKKLEKLRNYDEAFASYRAAYEKNPKNHEYRLYFERARAQAAIAHLDMGRKLREVGKLEEALAEFRRGAEIDPSNALAPQEIRTTQKMIVEREQKQEEEKRKLAEIVERNKVTSPRETLAPVNSTPIVLKLTGDLKRAFESIAKISGINVIFDSDLGNKLTTQVPVDLNNVTVIEALDLLALQTKTYWAVVNPNTIIVTNDNQQTRQFYEEQVIKTFYLGNTLATADLQEVLNTLRTLLDLRKVGVINSQNAIVIRDTADKIAMAERILQSIDKAKPEVLIDVAVMEVDRTYTQTLGVSPPTSVTGVNPPGGTGTTISIKDVDRLGSGNYYITIPTATFLATRTNARVLQNPSLRASDGKIAKLRIGTQQPVAQGSFQPTFGGTVGGSPVVQFTTIDVGVNLDLTPRVLLNRDVAMNVKVAIKSINGFETLSGNRYPILTNRDIEHDIRLKEGESSVIGGIISDSDSVSMDGIPGAQRIPLIKYLFGTESKTRSEAEVIIVITPHIVRLPDFQDSDLETLAIMGSGISPRFIGKPVQLGSGKAVEARPGTPVPGTPAPFQPGVTPAAATRPAESLPIPRLAFVKLGASPADLNAGAKFTIPAAVENAQDASTVSFALSFNPKILKLAGVQDGGFMSLDGKASSLSPRIDNDNGTVTVSLVRPAGSAGVSGNGVLVNLQFEAVGPGTTSISFSQATVADASQTALPTSSSGTQVTVK
ncbi:MAG: cohesin domain-containing protein [Acidobacteria bacterium]|nr:cohesin domain-containing protein [Acidobacteriota bacterium]MCI0723736.1 cohesin domain-containing protein [Acidobacteriota bacterium]